MGQEFIAQAAKKIKAQLSLFRFDYFSSGLKNSVDSIEELCFNGNHEEVIFPKCNWQFNVELALSTVDEIFETTDMVKQACNVALETLNDALTFDKIDENKLVLEKESINPISFVEDVIKPFEINANAAEVSLINKKWHKKLHSADSFDSLSIKGDKFKLNQVLRNLLSNAIKFTPPRGTVIVSTEIVSATGGVENCEKMVRIQVKDTGYGISKENLPKLFGQYVQFNANVQQKGGGSGLGLWISKSK
jgi:signal transduction histidine kinase